MNQPLLSILIPTIVGREKELESLLLSIKKQCDYEIGLIGGYGEKETLPVEVFWITDNKEMTIGEKREYMYSIANGIYSLQIDDDDDVSGNAIELILEAIKQEPDCITFEEYVNIDGREYKSNHSLAYPGWIGDGNQVLSDGFHFWRTPFFKSVIKTEIAKTVPIPHVRWGEDNMWADELHKHLNTEVHIDQQLYLYQHTSSNFNERYGYDRD